jgi:Ser/Thr protein kinase RdoA (MazF antagonist)
LAHGEKDVFRVHRSPAPDWVARLYPPSHPSASGARLLELVRLLSFLERNHYPAERIVASTDGSATAQIDQWCALVTTYVGPSLWPWQPISGPPSGLSSSRVYPGLFHDLGVLLGKLHALDTREPTTEPIGRSTTSTASELASASSSLARMADDVSANLENEYTQLTVKLGSVSGFDGCPETIVHGDCHVGNVVLPSDEECVLVDWDESGRGLAVTDLGWLLTSCIAPSDITPNTQAAQAIVDGYSSQRSISRLERHLLPDAVRFRPLMVLVHAFEKRLSPDYQDTDRFWGYTYDEWSRIEREAELIARAAQARLETVSPTDS